MEKKIINKPWGREEVIEINNKFMVKKLFMKKGHRCSLQYHEKKRETIYILEGKLKIYIGKSKDSMNEKIFLKDETITIESGVVHRMEAVEDSVYLEASTPEIDDVVRIKDDYNRK
tara:strand:- start:1580 stop:1927 length:348 start_codon:yes stop_codon:yes gene_type:complete